MVQAGSGARVAINNKGQTVSEINTSINTINKIQFLCFLAILRTFKELNDNGMWGVHLKSSFAHSC